MKRNCFILLACLAMACSKNLEVDAPDFQVTADPARLITDTFIYRIGDTTRFVFSGNAGNIAFYSGEAGRRYENRHARTQLGAITLSFSSKAEFGAQTGTLQLLATNSLSSLDSNTVVNEAWTDITSRAHLAVNATVVKSGAIDLTDLLDNEQDSLFIALKYSGVTGSTQRTWTITEWQLSNELPSQTIALSTFSSDVAYWTRYGNVWSPANARWTASATDLKITGGNAAAPTNTSWVISKPVYAGRIPPDVSIGVKSINEPQRDDYTYIYSAPGVYKVTFVAFNHTLDEEKRIVRELNIKVIP
jgi:hypothetical protein